MVETRAVIKLPVCCAACGSQQYETLLRISRATPLVCVECGQSIGLPHDNSAIFSQAVAFVEEERE
jgi:translation initiation factor 2 beta subunit (eIF-2beta)/eIF-5